MEPDAGVAVLTRAEASGNLPMVCMRCGEPATVVKAREFHTHQMQPRVGTLGQLDQLIRSEFSPLMQVRAPFCSRHQNHWWAQKADHWIFGAVVALGPVGSVVLIRLGFALEIVVASWLVATFCATCIYNIVRQRRGIILTEITPDYIVFLSVHPNFVEALDAQRRSNELREVDKEGAEIEVVCEECDRRASFPLAQEGSVQVCPHCRAYLDVAKREDSVG
jgi:hypothetical protein